ncbi:MAG: iron chaperone [Candidatus Dormibacteria bacterium]
MSPKKVEKTSPPSTSGRGSGLLSAEEKAAMRETLIERKRARSGGVDGESDVLAKIAEMAQPDRAIAERIHAIVKANAPTLTPKTFYGMPAYAKDGKVVCFFQSGAKFKSRYATFGFQQDANLDDGDLWPVSFAVNRLTAAVEKEIGRLVKKAVG